MLEIIGNEFPGCCKIDIFVDMKPTPPVCIDHNVCYLVASVYREDIRPWRTLGVSNQVATHFTT